MNIKRRYEEMARFLVFTAVFCLSSVMPHVLPAVEWTGRGQTTAWSDAGNWSEEKIPGPTDVAEFSSDSAILLSGDCVASCITNTSSSPITLKLTAESDVRLAASICGAISVEKYGAGTLTFAARQSYLGATRIFEGGITAAPDLSFENYKAYGTLSLHLDASRPETLITDESGYLKEWKSLTDNGVTTRGAAEAHAEEAFTHDSPYPYTDASGCTMVRFGYSLVPQSNTNTFISAWSGDSRVQFQAKTFFLVQRQRTAKKKTYGLLGMITGADFRFYRSGVYDKGWNLENMIDEKSKSWCNGREATNEQDNTFEESSDKYANLLVVRRSELGKFDIIGNQLLVNKGALVSGNNKESIKMDLYEVLLFDEALTDKQIEDVSALLMKKWKVPPQAVCLNTSLMPPESSFTVDNGAALDCGETVQTLSKVSGAGDFKVDGLIDLDGGMLKVAGGIGVTGSGVITNTAAEKALFVISNDTAAALAVNLSGNLDFEKQGSGTLWASGGQQHCGETRLNGGKMAATLDYSNYGTLSLHLDASHPETLITDEDGYLTEWKSLTDNGITTRGASVAHSTEKYTHESPFPLVDSSGRTTVRFGYTREEIRTNTFISAWKDDVRLQLQARTFFFVQRQDVETPYSYGLIGMISGTSFRFIRSNSTNNGWDTTNMAKSWCNGRKATSSEDNTFEESSSKYVNLLAVCCSELSSFDIIGNQFLMKGAGPNASTNKGSMPMDLYEVLLFDEALTDKQIEEISAYLMKKWNVPKQAEVSFDGVFATSGAFTVLADSVLDFAGYAPYAQMLKTIALSSSKIPTLTVVGDWNVATLPLTVENSFGTSRGTILRTTGSLTGPFALVTGVASDRLEYLTNEAMLNRSTFVITVR